MDSEDKTVLPEPLASNSQVTALPVVPVLPKIAAALDREGRAVVQAPPGAGKTTLVPLALLEAPWLAGKKIVMLEPRRLAARACAGHMATLLGERPGQTVGYQVRMERCIGPDTRIEIITEGILTRRIQADPELSDVGLLIFDEFHERHIHGDLGLALALESAEVFNPDLRILVMSATMDMDALSALMDGAPVIHSQGKTWPVETRYLPPAARDSSPGRAGDKGFDILPACYRAVKKALAEDEGDILVFLPGAAQIRALGEQLAAHLSPADGVDVYPLFGNLSPKAQAAAISPSVAGRRKIVLATTIAETSLTIQGVRVVVDSGLAKSPRFSPGRGMTRLETLPVSKASADQRRGRAGRTAPGVCYRLWSEHLHQGLIPFNRPEILSADLEPLVLELAQWGVADPGELKWLDVPKESAVAPARELLGRLGALDGAGRITDHGRRLLSAGSHPRLAHMVLRAKALNKGFTGCCLAALVEDRDFMPSGGDPDISYRLEILASLAKGRAASLGSRVNIKGARHVLAQARQLARRFKIQGEAIDPSSAGRLLAFAWPERIGRKRRKDSLSYLLSSGSGAFFRTANPVSGCACIVAVHLDGNPKSALIFLAAAYDETDLVRDFPDAIEHGDEVAWDEAAGAVRAYSRRYYGRLMLSEQPLAAPDPEAVKAALIQGIQRQGIDLLPWTKPLRQFRQRVIFLRSRPDVDAAFAALPDLCDSVLSETLADWLGPFLDGITSVAGLKRLDLDAAVKHLLSWDQQQMVDAHAPTHITVPSGSRIPVRYGDDNGPLDPPVLAVRLQEMFGLMTTPAIARNAVPLTLHLLSPAGRPVQITRDLANFWNKTYIQVKKDLMGRYPKHYWPDDPRAAVATNRVKPRGKTGKK
ncbi:MAG TPA: ATP-dependent helicase HrpB [Desulfobacteraceae bacterium]|nr:ATP-dependent helicase HrpB [Desulfobacteraceae bacterium]